MMNAAVFKTFGPATEVLNFEQTNKPSPKENQILVKTTLSPIHNHNILTVEGKYGYKPSLPAIGGSGAVGIIEEVGNGVTDLKVGDKVICTPVYQTWAEYFIAPVDSSYKIDPTIKDTDAAQLMDMPFSSLLLFHSLGLKSGDWIIQNAASGAVGKALCAIAAQHGVQVLSLVRSKKSVDDMNNLGFKNIISTSESNWKEAAQELLKGKNVKAGIDSIAGPVAPGELLSLMSNGSTLVSFGLLSGKPMEISPGDLIFKNITVKGFWATPLKDALNKEEREALLKELIGLIQKESLQLPVEEIYTLKEIKQAVAKAVEPQKKGKVLLSAI